MQEATIERLSKIISDPRSSGGSGGNGRVQRRPIIRIQLGLAEGWFSLFLLAAVLYSTIWCVQAAQWVNNLNILSLTTALGLVGGVIAAKQRRLPRLACHLLAVFLGLLLAFWQTAGADFAGNVHAFVNVIHQWIIIAMVGGTSSDDSIFLFFITALGFILAYTSAWLVYRTRNPWLMILANSVVLLINLSNIEAGYVVYLVTFLIASLLLLLRFNLYESSVRWKRLGLRCADDLGWDFMQAGALISIGILIVAWLLPWGYTDSTASQVWSADNNPWVQIQDTWNRLISVSGGANPVNHGNFTDTLTLGGNPNLNEEVVFSIQTSDPTQYIESLAYSTYDGRSWILPAVVSTSVKANSTYVLDSQYVRQVQQVITVVNPPGEQKAYLLGAPEIGSVNQDSTVLSSNVDGSVVAWLRTIGKLAAGNRYTVNSYVSSADENTLRSVPFPKDAPVYNPNSDVPVSPNYYDPGVVSTYTQLPKNLDPKILKQAQLVTATAPTMYDKALALEKFLHINYRYNTNINLPSGEEGVSWFLFRSGNQGFCNYFATAMAIMARELGMPARVVAGYTSGTKDPNHHDQLVIKGKDAHSWTQVYFAGYGWVNFEPSASFPNFTRPLTGSITTTTVTPGGTGPRPGNRLGSKTLDPVGGNGPGTVLSPAQSQALIRQDVSLALGGLILLALVGLMLFSLWWRRLFRNYGIAAQIYGRICILANWAGISIERSKTPYEYLGALATVAPEQSVAIERLGDIYVRDLWADPASSEHPRRTGEMDELPGLWKLLQPRLFFYVLRHPYFLRWLPERVLGLLSRRRSRKPDFDEDVGA